MITLLERTLALTGLSDQRNRATVRMGLALAVMAMAVRIVFWLTVDRYWEDALITCLHSENFWRGLGLSHYRPGEPPLHGFTSPLSVLIPLVGDGIRIGFGVNFLKLVSIPASGLTVLYLLALCVHPRVAFPWPLAFALLGYAAVEHQQILFGMAGMESQVVVLIVVMSIYYLVAWRPTWLGVSLGLCMLARPDLAFWCLIVGGYILGRDWRCFPRIAGIAMLLYAPWIIFTTAYYGSPIPHTILAKGSTMHAWTHDSLLGVAQDTWRVYAEYVFRTLVPVFLGHGAGARAVSFFNLDDPVSHVLWTGPANVLAIALFLLTVLGGVALIVKRQWALLPMALFVGVYGAYYVYLVPVVFPWYVVPYVVVMLFIALRGLQVATQCLSRGRNVVLGGLCVGYVALFVSVLPFTFHAEAMIQRYIENGVRMEAGLWFKEHLEPGDTIGCEPLGYLGYYSGGNIYDWPGLNSRAVVAWSRQVPPAERDREDMFKALRPTWLYLRDVEFLHDFEDVSWIRADYHPVKVFAVPEEDLAKIPWWWSSIDLRYRAYRKNQPGDGPYDSELWPK